MQLNLNNRAMGLSLLLASGLCLAACGDDTNTGADAGMTNTNKDATTTPGMDATGGNPDATGGNPDATGGGTDGGGGGTDGGGGGRDAGGGGNCAQGTEGCPCDPAMMCGAGLDCITWPQADMADPVIRTCAITCESDTDCAATGFGNTLCRGFFSNDGVVGICSKAEAPTGGACHGSRRPGSTRDITGCAQAELCLNNLGDADDGICAQICQVSTATPTGGCTGATPYCMPSGSGLVTRSSSTSMEFEPLGACAEGRITQGQRCSRRNPIRACDTSTLTVVEGNGHACIGFPDLPATEGVCIEICARNGGTCHNNEPGAGQAACTPYVPEMDDPDAALCVDQCSNFPDNCDGRGEGNRGRFCEDTWVFDQNFPLSFCVDRGTPPLMEAVVANNAGQPMITMADDCRPGQMSDGDAYRCPEGTFCLTLAQGAPGQGACIRGCTTSTNAPATGCTMTSSICQGGTDPADLTGICSTNN